MGSGPAWGGRRPGPTGPQRDSLREPWRITAGGDPGSGPGLGGLSPLPAAPGGRGGVPSREAGAAPGSDLIMQLKSL